MIFRTLLLVTVLAFTFSQKSKAQFISNGDFSSGASGWGCGAETNTEATYGGSGGNLVAEVDAGAGLCQTFTGLSIGTIYVVTLSASRRTGGCPSPAETNIDVTVSGGVLSTTITRTNTTFGFTIHSFLFMANSTSHLVSFSAGSGFGGSTCGMIIDDISVSFSPLPIELLYFDGKYTQANTVELNWSTASESNNSYFEIQRSNNGVDFENIVSLPSQSIDGNSVTRINYKCKDEDPLEGLSYYRLKQVDKDGSYSYSKLISVSSLKKMIHSEIYPNPGGGEFTLVTSSSGALQISIINPLGKTLYTNIHTITEEVKNVKLDLRNILKPGMYQCLLSGHAYNQTLKIVVE